MCTTISERWVFKVYTEKRRRRTTTRRRRKKVNQFSVCVSFKNKKVRDRRRRGRTKSLYIMRAESPDI
jgi:hypothetical protein